jgi:hypothetical protein
LAAFVFLDGVEIERLTSQSAECIASVIEGRIDDYSENRLGWLSKTFESERKSPDTRIAACRQLAKLYALHNRHQYATASYAWLWDQPPRLESVWQPALCPEFILESQEYVNSNDGARSALLAVYRRILQREGTVSDATWRNWISLGEVLASMDEVAEVLVRRNSRAFSAKVGHWAYRALSANGFFVEAGLVIRDPLVYVETLLGSLGIGRQNALFPVPDAYMTSAIAHVRGEIVDLATCLAIAGRIEDARNVVEVSSIYVGNAELQLEVPQRLLVLRREWLHFPWSRDIIALVTMWASSARDICPNNDEIESNLDDIRFTLGGLQH